MQKHIISFVFVFLLLIGGTMLFFAGKDYFETQTFIAQSVRTQGEVVDMKSYTDSKGNILYTPVVAFQDNKGEQHQVASDISSNPPDFQLGEQVEVFFYPENADKAKINTFFQLYSMSLVLGIIGSIFFTIGGIAIGLGIRRNRLKKWLLQNGEVIDAQVTSITLDTSIRVNGKSPYRIRCQYPDGASGFLREYKSDKLWRDPTAAVKNKIKVYRDPANSRRYYVFIDDLFSTSN